MTVGRRRVKDMRHSSERIAALITDSTMRVNHGAGWLKIVIGGALARIPSLKNNRQFGGVDRTVLDKLKALDSMFRRHVNCDDTTFFGDQEVFLFAVFGDRGGTKFDEDNALTTVKDWLEPLSKCVGRTSKRGRGWGIGLVNDDSQVRAFVLPERYLGACRKETTLMIRVSTELERCEARKLMIIGMRED
jgi:hypothetical protein